MNQSIEVHRKEKILTNFMSIKSKLKWKKVEVV